MVNLYRVVVGRETVVGRVEVEVDGPVDQVVVVVDPVEVVASQVATVVIAQHLIDKDGHTNIKQITDTNTDHYHYHMIFTRTTFSTCYQMTAKRTLAKVIPNPMTPHSDKKIFQIRKTSCPRLHSASSRGEQ